MESHCRTVLCSSHSGRATSTRLCPAVRRTAEREIKRETHVHELVLLSGTYMVPQRAGVEQQRRVSKLRVIS
ncbi:hypothetical protein NDU88_002254 [Pleurodeles waltl]|uniref:Uncharacterized protein n=1 Tax=Pleurodeles waltl TaxID=8319 RepID=A0AAV7KVL6_PLEWA|nr:hypothetical protein NDU88_002254 [Pleurodeles waltl]